VGIQAHAHETYTRGFLAAEGTSSGQSSLSTADERLNVPMSAAELLGAGAAAPMVHDIRKCTACARLKEHQITGNSRGGDAGVGLDKGIIAVTPLKYGCCKHDERESRDRNSTAKTCPSHLKRFRGSNTL
jgi:hypothetical protein